MTQLKIVSSPAGSTLLSQSSAIWAPKIILGIINDFMSRSGKSLPLLKDFVKEIKSSFGKNWETIDYFKIFGSIAINNENVSLFLLKMNTCIQGNTASNDPILAAISRWANEQKKSECAAVSEVPVVSVKVLDPTLAGLVETFKTGLKARDEDLTSHQSKLQFSKLTNELSALSLTDRGMALKFLNELNLYVVERGKHDFNVGKFLSKLKQKFDGNLDPKLVKLAFIASAIRKVTRLVSIKTFQTSAATNPVEKSKLGAWVKLLTGKKFSPDEAKAHIFTDAHLPVNFLLSALDEFLQKNSTLREEEARALQHIFERVLESSCVIASSTQHKNPNSEQFVPDMVYARLMTEGGVTMMSGWIGHAITSEIFYGREGSESVLYLRVYNAGSGIYKMPGTAKDYRPVSVYKYSGTDIKGVIRNFFVFSKLKSDKAPRLFYTQFLKANNLTDVTPGLIPSAPDGFLPQTVGNCSVRSPLELMRFYLMQNKCEYLFGRFMAFCEGLSS